MRGKAPRQAMTLTAIAAEAMVPKKPSLFYRIKPLVDAALIHLSPTFDQTYARPDLRRQRSSDVANGTPAEELPVDGVVHGTQRAAGV